MNTFSIIIPVKDEEIGLNYLLKNYKDSDLNKDRVSFIFVIDGRTSDLSRKIASEFSEIIIDQKETHGKGAAVRQALNLWRKKPSSHVIFMDADGSYCFKSVIEIISKLEEGYDVVSGSRFLNGNKFPKGMNYLHIFGNRFLSIISSIRNRKKISDLCTGLWGFNSQSINKLNLSADGFDLEAEIMGKIRKNKLRHTEIPVNWSARKGGFSKLRSFKDGSIILFRILRT